MSIIGRKKALKILIAQMCLKYWQWSGVSRHIWPQHSRRCKYKDYA